MNTRRGFFGMIAAGLAALFCRQDGAPSLGHSFHSRNWAAGAWQTMMATPAAAKSWHFFPGDAPPSMGAIIERLRETQAERINELEGLVWSYFALCPRNTFVSDTLTLPGWELYVEWRKAPEIIEGDSISSWVVVSSTR